MNKFIQHDLTADIVKTNNPRIGVIALSTDFTIEQDYRNICHQLPVDIFVNRIPFENPLNHENYLKMACLLYTSPSPRDRTRSRMPSSA